jgi:hypothetical protein
VPQAKSTVPRSCQQATESWANESSSRECLQLRL